MSDAEPRMFTQDQVSAIVKRRVASMKYSGPPEAVITAMLERMSDLEQRIEQLEKNR